jgi:hypothetical protein
MRTISRYFFLMSVLSCSALLQCRKENALQRAVENSDFQSVQLALKKIKASPLTATTKAELAELYEVAQDIHDDGRRNLSITSNLWDLSKAAGGTLFALWGYSSALSNLKKRWDALGGAPGAMLDPEISWRKTLSASGIAAIGTYLAYKGISCSVQKQKIERAQKIQNLLEGFVDDSSDALRNRQIDRAKRAIDLVDIKLVRQQLTKMDQNPLPDEERRQDLKSLLEDAETAVEEQSEAVSFKKNKRDLAKFAGGLVAGLLGSVGFYGGVISNYRDRNPQVSAYIGGSFFGIAGLIGISTAIQGWRCTSQLAKIRDAKKIEQLVERRISDLPAKTQ